MPWCVKSWLGMGGGDHIHYSDRMAVLTSGWQKTKCIDSSVISAPLSSAGQHLLLHRRVPHLVAQGKRMLELLYYNQQDDTMRWDDYIKKEFNVKWVSIFS